MKTEKAGLTKEDLALIDIALTEFMGQWELKDSPKVRQKYDEVRDKIREIKED